MDKDPDPVRESEELMSTAAAPRPPKMESDDSGNEVEERHRDGFHGISPDSTRLKRNWFQLEVDDRMLAATTPGTESRRTDPKEGAGAAGAVEGRRRPPLELDRHVLKEADDDPPGTG